MRARCGTAPARKVNFAVHQLRFVLLLVFGTFACTVSIAAQGVDPQTAVRAAVNAELNYAREDHSAWSYRDHDSQPGKDAVYEVIETPKGDLRRMVELNGHPLAGSAEQDEINRIRNFVSSPSDQARQRREDAHDDAQARELLTMLPNAFVWTVVGENPQEITLHFKPNPSFRPPDMQSRVLGVMAGEMVIARDGNHIQTLKGTLTDDVKIGFGLLGKIDKGGTFDVERREIAPGHWQITQTHVHIGGHALLFKTIGQQEDDTKSEWRPSTAPNLQVAEQQILH